MSDPMDIFRTLTAGGVRFDKRRHGEEMKRFAELEREKDLEMALGSDMDDDDDEETWEDGADDLVESAGEDEEESEAAPALFASSTRDDKNKGKNENEEEEDEEAFQDSDEEEEGEEDEDKKKKKKRNKKKKGQDGYERPGAVLLRHMHLAPELAAQWEQVHKAYRSEGIRVAGNDITMPLRSFEELVPRYGVSARLVANVRRAGLETPTPIQMAALPAMLEGREVIGIAPTGSGKTLAYVLPLVHTLARRAARAAEAAAEAGKRGYRSIVLSPTRELAIQIYRVIRRFAEGCRVRVALLTKGAVDARARVPARSFDILVATPLRLVKMILARQVDLSIVRTIVFDEADRLFDQQFVEQIDEIVAACQKSIAEKVSKMGKGKEMEMQGEKKDEKECEKEEDKEEEEEEKNKPQEVGVRRLQVCLFSATMMPQVEQLAGSLMTSPVRVLVGKRNVSLRNIEQRLVFAGNEQGKLIALERLLDEGAAKTPALVFVQNKERALDLRRRLQEHAARAARLVAAETAGAAAAPAAMRVSAMYSELSPAQRERAVQDFRAGRIWVLVSTDMMSRGMDFRGVACVVNYDMPQSVADYVHRVGRTGRAGARGLAFSFYTEDDAEILRLLAATLAQSGCAVPEWVRELRPLSLKRKKYLRYHAVRRSEVGGARNIRPAVGRLSDADRALFVRDRLDQAEGRGRAERLHYNRAKLRHHHNPTITVQSLKDAAKQAPQKGAHDEKKPKEKKTEKRGAPTEVKEPKVKESKAKESKAKAPKAKRPRKE